MVNHGVSRGCETCKKRRKKASSNCCDDTRPACTRCLKSRRVCLGYKDESTLIFRHYEPTPRITYRSPISWWSPEVSDSQLEASALGIFTAEFVVESRDRRHSRGFLDGMQSLLGRVDAQSGLARAARALVLASVANRTGRESLREVARRQYGELLGWFGERLREDGVSIESLYTAVLLGFFEIIASSEMAMQHVAHVKGVCAILRGGVVPFDLTKGVQFVSLGNPLVLRSPVGTQSGAGLFCVPFKDGRLQSLDSTLIKFAQIFGRAEHLLPQDSPSEEELVQLERDALALDEEFKAWGTFDHGLWTPDTVGVVRAEAAEASGCAYCYEGKVHKYFDYYVAAVWNTWRKAQLVHMDVIVRLARILSRTETIPEYEERASVLVTDMKASIPYHLSADVEEYFRLADAGAPFIPPNRPVGGLLLLHPLYAAARCTITPLADRMHFGETLRWIGEYMGIGQATLLVESLRSGVDDFEAVRAPELPFMDFSEGHVLIWAGMMLEPRGEVWDEGGLG
ncbi:hypothetical protein ACJ41O_001162 [Fusarium nematophilum]